MAWSRCARLFSFATACLACSLAGMAQTTDLRVTKSGNDVVFSWTGGTANYNVTGSNGSPQFQYPQTLGSNLTASPYAYSNGLTNGVALQFFDVAGTTETSPAGTYTGGAIPPPAPIISTVSPTTGLKVGDILTINGSGFSTIPKEDVVHFPEGITVTANISPAPTATSFQVTIPRGAFSGPMWVQVGHQISSTTSLVILIQNGFAHLSGVAFQPTTKDIWLSDRSLGTSLPTRIYQLTFSGAAWTKTASEIAGTGTIKYQGGQGLDSAEAWYYGMADSEVNGGTRKKATNPPAGATPFTQVKPGSGDSVSVLGVATSPALTDTAFFAYNDVTTGEKHIRKIAGSGVLVTDYGNFGAMNLGFNSLAGLVLDQAGNLFDTETSQVREITPSQSSSVVATGLTTAFGITQDQVNASDPGMLLVSDFGAGALVAVDLLSSPATKATVVSGLALPRAASFAVTPLNAATCGGLTNTDLSFVAIGEDTQVRQITEPRISLTPSGPARVWISKKRTDDAYPASYQSADHQITITATMTPTPTTQRTICFRVVDPPDTAPYSDGTTTGFWCDNKDPGTSNNAGKLSTSPSGPWNNVVCVTTVGGQASVILNTTDRYAGDNYIVQASYDSWNVSNTTKALAETGIITTWKRVYIEKDKMFRRGAVLVENCAACSALRVADGENLQNGDSIVVFDETTTAENGGETRTVSGAPTNNGDGSWTVNLSSALTKTYYASGPPKSGTYGPRDFSNAHSGGVGVSGAGYYEADLSAMWQAYNDAFVEYWVPPDGANAVPYLDPVSMFYDSGPTFDTTRTMFSTLWFAHAQGINPNNYIHLLGVRGKDYVPPSLTGGISIAANKYSYIYIHSWETAYSLPSDIAKAIQDATDHEFGHQFRTNYCTDLLNCGTPPPTMWGQHDYRGWWNYGGTGCPPWANPCLMDPGGGNPTSGITRFCKEDLFSGDPNAPCNGGVAQKVDTAVRTIVDPIP